MSDSKNRLLLIDLGPERSLCSSLFLAKVIASEKPNWVIDFYLKPENSHFLKDLDCDNLSPQYNSNLVEDKKYDFIVDFTLPGCGLSESASLDQEATHYYLTGSQMDALNCLQDKADYLGEVLGINDLVQCISSHLKGSSAVLTYSAKLAASLNLQGIPTIEFSYKNESHGSFLPGSLVVVGDDIELRRQEDLRIVFELYKNKRLDDLFTSKGVLEVDWKFVYYQFDDTKKAIKLKNYPVSNTEDFMDIFFRNFLVVTGQQAFSVEKLLELSRKMDMIDLESTIAFLRKSLRFCLDDLDECRSPLAGPYWSLVSPYLGYDTSGREPSVRRRIRQAYLGLDLIERITKRQRKVMSLH